MSRSILLINPWIYDFAAYDFWIKPIGLLYIAGILRRNGYDIRFIDCLNPAHPELCQETNISMPGKRKSGMGKYPREIIPKPDALKSIPQNYSRYGITPRIFMKELALHRMPDLIFVTSMMTYWYPGVRESIRLIKSVMPHVPVVLGGNYVTLCPDHAATIGADVTVCGEGEMKLSALLNNFFGDELSFIPDYRCLDSYPYPAYELLPFIDQAPILTSRGCPFRCAYCASHVICNEFRRRDPLLVVDEIEFWNKSLGITHFSFYDDALLVAPEEFAVPMLREIVKRQLRCHFHCPNGLHLREITEPLCKLMMQSGFKTIRFGFETSNQTMQVSTGGKVTNEQLKKAVAHLTRAGYQSKDLGVYLLCGLPGQETEEIHESIEFVRACGARPIITEYSPIPGTSLWEEAVTHSPYDLSNEPLFHNNSLLPCSGEKLTYEMYQGLKLMTRNV